MQDSRVARGIYREYAQATFGCQGWPYFVRQYADRLLSGTSENLAGLARSIYGGQLEFSECYQFVSLYLRLTYAEY